MTENNIDRYIRYAAGCNRFPTHTSIYFNQCLTIDLHKETSSHGQAGLDQSRAISLRLV